MKRKVNGFSIAVITMVLVLSFSSACCVRTSPVFGWSNGGYSTDPFHPKYGTHDWIAEHALDWLSSLEKQSVIGDHVVDYLYGTELPDNGQAPDGIGDTTKHHVYYFANGALQDNSSAVRALEEYSNAVALYTADDVAGAAKRLGVMSHYIVDVAVFGHVMGSGTAWGSEVHHSDYETYVNERTNSYEDDFNSYLVFDGELDEISAYNATLMLANNTTFDNGGTYMCTWMDQNYDWNYPEFKNRCGESLNLAVNLIADVLHTFYEEIIVPEFTSVIVLLPALAVIAVIIIAKRKKTQLGVHRLVRDIRKRGVD